MDDQVPSTLYDRADSPAPLRPQQIMEDLSASEADEAAGRTDSGADLLADMDRVAAEMRANSRLKRMRSSHATNHSVLVSRKALWLGLGASSYLARLANTSHFSWICYRRVVVFSA